MTAIAEGPAVTTEIVSGGKIHHLRTCGVSLVVDGSGPRLPRIVHWGADLGELSAAELAEIATHSETTPVSNVPDVPVTLSVIAEHASGWPGTPGLLGHRSGRDWSSQFDILDCTEHRSAAGAELVFFARDTAIGLALTLHVALSPEGLVRMRATVVNEAPDEIFDLQGLLLSLPVPAIADEVLDFGGRHLRERTPQRHPFGVGALVRDSRRGRTGHDSTPLVIAGTAGFGFGSGQVWGLHVAWSGNHRTIAERWQNSQGVLSGGELLLPGEALLGPGAAYTTPWVVGSYGAGLDELSHRFHRHLRARPGHPHSPRPVLFNTWESVYFDMDRPRLAELAELAATAGCERYVLDDGWFTGRRSDKAGLGDWTVDRDVWPDGLHPLVEHVHRLGMQFGIWVEPEMINLDSVLARAHPDWVMSVSGRMPIGSRYQQVLDLTHADAFEHILNALDALVTEYAIDYLKWDHNRDLVESGHSPAGTPAVHGQTLAVYALMDELRRRHPGLEIESCASGGGRIDLEILQHTDRVWTSDCIDALERQHIQRWTGLLVPPELMGMHIGADRSHTTDRRHDLSFRAGTALFGHLGIEATLTEMSPAERAELADWVALHQRLRPLLHSGRVVRVDHVDPSLLVHGVVADDSREAVFSVAALKTSEYAPTGRLHLPALDPLTRYRVSVLGPLDALHTSNKLLPAWLEHGTVLSGSSLRSAGLAMPELFPEHLLLLHVVAE